MYKCVFPFSFPSCMSKRGIKRGPLSETNWKTYSLLHCILSNPKFEQFIVNQNNIYYYWLDIMYLLSNGTIIPHSISTQHHHCTIINQLRTKKIIMCAHQKNLPRLSLRFIFYFFDWLKPLFDLRWLSFKIDLFLRKTAN